MHNTAPRTRTATTRYRERLSPSLWALLGAAVAAPMVTLVFVPMDATVALVLGVLAAAALIAVLIAAAPVIAIDDGELRVGRAHIPVDLLGRPEALTGERARALRGPELPGGCWHLLRGGIDGVVRVPVRDPDDPVGEWIFSSRTPDRVAAMIVRAQQR